MIQMGSVLDVADNSGAKRLRCIKVLGGSGKMSADICDEIVVSVVDAIPHSKVKKGDVYRAVLVRAANGVSRADGSFLRFDSNAAVLLSNQGELIGSRIFCPVPRELRSSGYMKIVSLAPEVL